MGSGILHELYFVNLGGDGKVSPAIASALETYFGSVARWRREFVGVGRSLAGGSGWVVLSYSCPSPKPGRRASG
jgi:superoxide dismutase, Fe-Mn family